MKNAVSARCCTVEMLLLTWVMLSVCTGMGFSQAPQEETPAPAAATAKVITPQKQMKLTGAFQQGAQAYEAGRFDVAAQFYDSALQLDPANEKARNLAENARRMSETRRKELSRLPKDPKEREAFLGETLATADQFYADRKFEKAYEAYFKIWLASGDLQGKTRKMMLKSQAMFASDAPPAVPVAAVNVASASVAPAVVPVAQGNVITGKVDEPVTVVVKDDQEMAATPPAAVAPPVDEPAARDTVDDVTKIQVTRMLKSAEELSAAGKPEEARKNIIKVLELWPANPQARPMLDKLNTQLGYSRRDLANTYMSEGNAFLKDQRFEQAIARYREVLKVDPNNEAAVSGIAKAELGQAKGKQLTDVKTRLESSHEIDVLQKQASKAYDAGDLKKARATWQQILDQDPGNKMAQTFIEETKAAYERLKADETTRAKAEKRSEAAEKLLNAPITISTDRKIPLSEFMYSLSFATPVELEYYIAQGANAMIFANFVDKPLREVLDTVLLPIGLSWSIDNKNTITIEPKFVSQAFTLSASQMSKVRSLMDSGQLQKLVWNQTEPPAEGVSITLDERQSLLVVTGSQQHIKKIESLLPTLQVAQEQEMTVKIYKIKKEDGPRIKSLINSIIAASSNTPFDLERKIFIDGEDLIVRDTPENITKIEELLMDKKFIEGMRDEKIDISNFSMVPRDVENIKSDQIQAFTARVVEAIKTFLYSQEGESQANKDGRRLWYDPATLQLTVVDTPTNIARVAEYIESLPELGQKSRQEVKFLKFAVAEDLSSSLERILDLTTSSASGQGGGGGTEVVLKLRRGEERQFRDARIRVLRVEQSDPQDRKSGTVEISINSGIQVSTVSLRELDTQYLDDYELTAEDVLASSGQPGEGTARIRIRYIPQGLNGGGQMTPEQLKAMAPEKTPEEQGITINPFGELNAIILRYTNPALYKEAMQLITQLDQPTNQVQIETKFVEVNETRAKEFSADFNIAGLGQGKDINWSQQNINTRFAQDVDEFRDAFSPPIENPTNANLIKGTTVLNAVIGGFPNLQYSLRLLEAEGIINIINGPKVTALDGQEAEFRIEQYVPRILNQQATNIASTIINPLDQAFTNLQLADQDEANNNNQMITAVVLRVTPEITSKDSIILNNLSAELIDFDGWLGSIVTPTVQGAFRNTGTSRNPFFTTALTVPTAMVNQGQMLLKRKKILTDARISNGGTIVIGGWTGERTQELTSGLPVLRNMPYLGKLLFSRAQRTSDRTTLLIFLTGNLVD